MTPDFEWAGWRDRRCKARLNEKFLIYRGRCDRKRDHGGVHALERGMEIIEFHTTWTRRLSQMGEFMVAEQIRKRGLV